MNIKYIWGAMNAPRGVLNVYHFVNMLWPQLTLLWLFCQMWKGKRWFWWWRWWCGRSQTTCDYLSKSIVLSLSANDGLNFDDRDNDNGDYEGGDYNDEDKEDKDDDEDDKDHLW